MKILFDETITKSFTFNNQIKEYFSNRFIYQLNIPELKEQVFAYYQCLIDGVLCDYNVERFEDGNYQLYNDINDIMNDYNKTLAKIMRYDNNYFMFSDDCDDYILYDDNNGNLYVYDICNLSFFNCKNYEYFDFNNMNEFYLYIINEQNKVIRKNEIYQNIIEN